jgi:hypothetical protein
VLLAWLDGEGSLLLKWQIRQHLQRCWSCRERVHALNEAIRATQQSFASLSAPTREEIEIARWRFWQTVQAHALSPKLLSAAPPWALLYALAVACSVMAVLFVLARVPRPMLPSAAQTLASLEHAETARMESVAYREVLEFSIASGNGPEIQRKWQLWAEPQKGLYKGIWTDASGQIERALFLSDQGPYRYSKTKGLDAGPLPHASTHESLARAVSAACESQADLQAAIVNWVEGQLWRPVFLAREMEAFQTETGAKLVIIQSGQALRMEAHATVDQAHISVILQTPPSPTGPTLLEITWRKAAMVRVVHISCKQDTLVSPLPAFDFRPENVLTTDRDHLAPRWRSLTHQRRYLNPVSLEAAQVYAWEVLHKLGLCTQGIIHVENIHNGIQVKGVIADAELRQKLIASFRALPDRDLIHLDIENPAQIQHPQLILTPVPDALVSSQPAPIETWLKQNPAYRPKLTEHQLFDLMNQLVTAAEMLSTQSAAMSALAEQFPAAEEKLLPQATREHLINMEADHWAAAYQALEQIQRSLPLFVPLVPSHPVTDSDAQKALGIGVDWQSRAINFHAQASAIVGLVLELFSSHSSAQTASQKTQAQLQELQAHVNRAAEMLPVVPPEKTRN